MKISFSGTPYATVFFSQEGQHNDDWEGSWLRTPSPAGWYWRCTDEYGKCPVNGPFTSMESAVSDVLREA